VRLTNACIIIINIIIIISDHRKDACLNLFGKAVCGKVAILVNKLKQPTEVTRSSDGATFTAITTRTDAYKFSFFSPYSSWMELTRTPFAVKADSHTFLLN